MQKIKISRAHLTVTLYILLCLANASSGVEFDTKAGRFTIDSCPTFLFGVSYYGALGAPRDSVLKDLDDMQHLGVNWIRVWATWGAFGNDVSAVDARGQARQPYFERLRWLITECDRRGMIVDVTLSRGEGVISVGPLEAVEAHRRAVTRLASELHGLRNWYVDLANENNIRGRGKKPKTLSFEVLSDMRSAVQDIDPKRLVTVSYVRDATEDELRHYLLDVEVDFVSPHRVRRPGCAEQTEGATKQCIELMRRIGRVVPVHYQEPFRRDFNPSRFQPNADDFATDLRGAIDGGAAGWCFHNGDNRSADDGRPRRSFDMREQRLFDQLDPQEHKALATISRIVKTESLARSAVNGQ
jgi:hypothetical protein